MPESQKQAQMKRTLQNKQEKKKLLKINKFLLKTCWTLVETARIYQIFQNRAKHQQQKNVKPISVLPYPSKGLERLMCNMLNICIF